MKPVPSGNILVFEILPVKNLKFCLPTKPMRGRQLAPEYIAPILYPNPALNRLLSSIVNLPLLTVLLAGMRVLNANYKGSDEGVLTNNKGSLTNDFFTNLLSMDTYWTPASEENLNFIGKNRSTDKETWTASRADLIFGSNSELRAIAEVYASDDAKEKFATDFIKAWTKVMNLDRF